MYRFKPFGAKVAVLGVILGIAIVVFFCWIGILP